MKSFIFFALGVIIGTIVVSLIRANRRIAREQNTAKQVNKEKILAILAAQDQVSNDTIERALGVSDATATRYLDELEKEGKIIQIGKTGRTVHYKKA